MTFLLRCVLVCVSILLTLYLLRRIRHSKMKIEDSIFWVMFALLLVLFSLFPKLADFISGMVGTYSTANFIFTFMIFILLLKVFFQSVKISQLERRVTELIQTFALDKEEDKEKEELNYESNRE
ncbi:DUF2304 domain-containing protein [Lacrimispora algidixylanolytica]|uniref:Glycosyl transferase n=1 Tax=Lacrimispora algidixylanolytica TaxID=94868 RepID=A0A419TBN7_9FIRM|nr:DUF2304 domain-containing protein [Lacrimispora algidixylanolytica]RKD34873.1 glycosyl transferase [Lacrimispora algidixylanolytica]